MANLPDDKLDALAKRFDSIEAALAAGPAGDTFVRLSKEYAELEPVVRSIAAYRRLEGDLADAEELRRSPDREMAEMAEAEYAELRPKVEAAAQQVRILLLPKDAADERSVILEVRAGTGGDEAALFAGDLLRMYQRYADLHGWRFELLEASDGEAGGYKEAIASISGRGAYARLKYESGVHRVQRVPATEAQGRIHTSAATVAVLPEAQEVDLEIRPEDLSVETLRASSKGGQHANTTASAIRMTHIPTGVTVSVSSRSQHQNRAQALEVMRSRLYALEREKLDTARSSDRREQVGSGDRSERIRTYNFPQGRVTDHRINLTLYNLEKVIAGEALDDLIEALITEHQTAQLAAMEGSN